MDNSTPRGTPNSGDNASRNTSRNSSRIAPVDGSLNAPLAQTISHQADTAVMGDEPSLDVTLYIDSPKGQYRWRQIIESEPRPYTQLASRNQAGFNTRMANPDYGAQNNTAEFGRSFNNDDNNDNGANGISSFGNHNNSSSGSYGSYNVPRGGRSTNNQTFSTQHAREGSSYNQGRFISHAHHRSSTETDEGAASSAGASLSGRGFDYQPSPPNHVPAGSSRFTRDAAHTSRTRQTGAPHQPIRRSGFVADSPRSSGCEDKRSRIPSQRQVGGQSARNSQGRQNRHTHDSENFGDIDGGMGLMRQSSYEDVRDSSRAYYNTGRDAAPRPRISLRGNESSSTPRLDHAPNSVSGRYNMAGKTVPHAGLALRGHETSSTRRQGRPPANVSKHHNLGEKTVPGSGLALRGHENSSGLQRLPTDSCGTGRPRQPPFRELYVPEWQRGNASRSVRAESSRDAEARLARQRAEDPMESVEYTTSDLIKEEDYDEEDDGEYEESEGDIPVVAPNANMNADWRRNSEDAKTPHLKVLGVVCEHVANCSTDSPFRKAISTFFGRNKKCIRDIPEEILIHFCRKHYQRCKFRDNDGWTQKQCEMIAETFNRIETWSNGNRARGVGAVVTGWTIELRKREAERQVAKKNAAAAKKKFQADRKGKGKAPADSEDEDSDSDDDSYPTDGSPPRWMMRHIGRNLTFEKLRQIFARLRNECLALKTNKLPDIEFLPVIEWIGGAKPAVVTYKRRAPARQTPAKKPTPKGKGKAKAIILESEVEEEYYTDEEDYEDSSPPRKRKRNICEDEDEMEYSQSRARVAMEPTPSQRNTYVQRPRSPAPDHTQSAQRPPARELYVPRNAIPTYKDPTDKPDGGSK